SAPLAHEPIWRDRAMTFDLPYFDEIIDRLARSPDSSLSRAVQRHVHWGLFSAPYTDDDSLTGFLVAAEAMTERVCAAARVRSGLHILDVGCGFGPKHWETMG
ncbi:MAG TPA: hypothetical protein VIX89_08255, partial [Bryobacteraceae bacterium]